MADQSVISDLKTDTNVPHLELECFAMSMKQIYGGKDIPDCFDLNDSIMARGHAQLVVEMRR